MSKMVDYEAMLLAIRYIETIIDGDEYEHKVISDNIPTETLLNGLSSLSLIFIEFASKKLATNREEVIETIKKTALSELLNPEE